MGGGTGFLLHAWSLSGDSRGDEEIPAGMLLSGTATGKGWCIPALYKAASTPGRELMLIGDIFRSFRI
ncbi:hypothetical protein LVD17_19265 [Fulvivirga ulvae]|uniref:hypothetical protein n=1 Tax=Fulvivirga ulvae TaxID=2904245 RepID=UPI001F48E08D|nr:hypothetical protein [Fulvivirga ulvae]UII30435.1 hypothetical protein LVD17_19265 [Fulvivirga ulvae]